MFSFSTKSIITIGALVSLLTLTACSEESPKPIVSTQAEKQLPATSAGKKAVLQPILEVYKSPTCTCCEKWLDHIDQHGFISKAHNQENLSTFKSNKGIAPQYRSCHTAVSKDGYVFEGHVPAKFIHQFLAEKPANAIGLSVPAMPIGTPGMEVDDKFMPYKVILLKADGSYEVFAELNNYQEQF